MRIADAAVPTIDLDGRAPSLEPELCEHLGIAAQWHTTSDPMTGWELLQAELAAGNPVLVHADLAELDYREGDRHDTRHAIVVTSCDADGGRRLGRRRQASPSRSAAACARSPPRAPRRAGPSPPTTGCSPCARGPSGSPTRTRPSRRRCGRVVAAMRHPARPDHPHVRAGLAAADALAAAWPRLPDAAGPRLGATLAALRFRIRDGGTGGALYRSLQARFLHEAAALLGSPELGHAALVCDDLADAWRALAGVDRGRRPRVRPSRRRTVGAARLRARARARRGARGAPQDSSSDRRLSDRKPGAAPELARASPSL